MVKGLPPTDTGVRKTTMASNHKGCAVVYCSNTYYNVKEKKKLNFFGFPKDPERYNLMHFQINEMCPCEAVTDQLIDRLHVFFMELLTATKNRKTMLLR